MAIPVRITFRDIPSSEAVEAKIHERAAKLEKFAERATGLNVIVAAPHGRSQGPTRKGQLYHFTLELLLPKGEVVVHKGDTGDHSHEDIYVAMRDAFKALERRAQEHFAKLGDH